jgi:N-acetylneuraminic acid mutarotase
MVKKWRKFSEHQNLRETQNKLILRTFDGQNGYLKVAFQIVVRCENMKTPFLYLMQRNCLKRILLAFFFVLGLQVYAQNWQQLSDFPGTSRDDGVAFRLGDTAYFGTGFTPWWSPEGDFYGFDLTSETWFSAASLPTGEERQYACAFTSSTNQAFVFGGYNGSEFLNDVWCYDASLNQWMAKSPLPSFGRSGACCFVLNDTAYIVGGKSASNFALDEVWAYSIANDSWSQKNNLPFGPRWRASSIPFNNKGYLLFGRDDTNSFHNELFAFDPLMNSWQFVSEFPAQGRSHASLFPIGDFLYVCFGIDTNQNAHNDLWRYDVASNMWSTLPGLPSIGRRGGMAVSTDVGLYYTTGIDENNQRMNETWKYSPYLGLTDIPHTSNEKVLFAIYDMLGRATTVKPNELLLYVYSDGSTEKVFHRNEE